MLVRYFPTQWTSLLRGQMRDGALPTLLSVVDMIEREFPRTIVDHVDAAKLNF